MESSCSERTKGGDSGNNETPFKNSSLNGWRDLDGSQKTKVKKYYRMGNLSSILYDNEWRTKKRS